MIRPETFLPPKFNGGKNKAFFREKQVNAFKSSSILVAPGPAQVLFHEQMILEALVVQLATQALLLVLICARAQLLLQRGDLFAQLHFEREHAGVFQNAFKKSVTPKLQRKLMARVLTRLEACATLERFYVPAPAS